MNCVGEEIVPCDIFEMGLHNYKDTILYINTIEMRHGIYNILLLLFLFGGVL